MKITVSPIGGICKGLGIIYNNNVPIYELSKTTVISFLAWKWSINFIIKKRHVIGVKCDQKNHRS